MNAQGGRCYGIRTPEPISHLKTPCLKFTNNFPQSTLETIMPT
ncbi:MAG: hypothetical protein ACLSCV_00160 [Acutalibacteraceae bacterium]